MKILSILILVALVLSSVPYAHAEISKGASMSSTNFKILDAQHSIIGGLASASSSLFELITVMGDFAIGSASSANFGLLSGFLYYPKVVAPVLNTATAGDGQVALAWTAASAYSGLNIGGYNICHKSTGSYTCVDTSSTGVSATKTGLTNGTTYTFKIQAYDGIAAKNVIAESNEKTAAPAAVATPTPTPTPASGGGGGGGGGATTTVSGTGTVLIKGTAYPNSTVNVLLDGVFVSQIDVGSNSGFEITLNSVSAGSRLVNLFSTDTNNRKSITVGFTVTVTANTSTSLTNVLMPPTIDVSSTSVAKGQSVRIFGYAEPTAEVNIHVASEETVTKTISDSNGAYALLFNTTSLAEEEHTTKSRAVFESLISPFSHVLQFFVGKGGPLKTADLNKEGKVNIIDFSVLLFWWNTKQARGIDIADINNDGKVNIVDFSIMLFQWTG